MEALATAIAVYAIIGLLLCLILSFRRRKHPKAMMAADFFGMGGSLEFPILVLLWPLFLFVQFVEEKNLSDEPKKKKAKNDERVSYEGCIGTTATSLMPSGTVIIDEKHIDAVSEEGSIEEGEKIEVVGLSMNTIKVRRFQP